MKQKIRSFVTYLVNSVEAEKGADITFHELSIFIAFWVACVKMKKDYQEMQISNRSSKGFNQDFSHEIKQLTNRFGELAASFLEVHKKISPATLEHAYSKLLNAFKEADEDRDDIISWAYQFSKRGLEKKAFASVGANNKKIEAQDLLFTTQFFTDRYMVRYLVEESIKKQNRELDKLIIIDPASGGGNFLIYGFDCLYGLYKKQYSAWSDQKIVDKILSEALVGYDLDGSLSRIATLSLYVKACEKAIPSKKGIIRIFGGIKDDQFGFLAPRINSNFINEQSFHGLLESTPEDIARVFLTNPPFMGKRDMDVRLRNFLVANYPQSKGDLCVSFMQRMIELMRPYDIIGVVAQNSWTYLSSLKDFRSFFLRNQQLQTFVDLGSNAFQDINGEKTNVGLFIIGKSEDEKSTFYSLKYKSRAEKKTILETNDFEPSHVFRVNQIEFFKNENFEFSYHFEERFTSLNTLPKYSDFGKPMQGSSTGDSSRFVKYAWEVNENPDWKMVSKGGGFSKWMGLNYYKVLWGRDGDAIKKNQGSALRNVNKMDVTQLVFSDTGSLGLNVRVLKPGQVFIASGPGIQVLDGDVHAHIAFLNSKISTFLLKILNPKFTISAGYISRIPVSRDILFSSTIASNSKKCLKLKESYLKTKLPNLEFSHNNYSEMGDLESYIQELILADINSDFQRLVMEFEIEKEIRNAYSFTDAELSEVKQIVGESTLYNKKNNQLLECRQIDKLVASSIDVNCQINSKTLNGYSVGSESVIENISHRLDVDPKKIFNFLKNNIANLKETKQKYLADLIHKLILFELEVKSINDFTSKVLKLEELTMQLLSKYPFLNQLKFSSEYLSTIILVHHKNSFLNCPLVLIDGDKVRVGALYG
ncbi:Eco57I restriction-modification methylase domain-containing protein [Pedobacter aquatilis]|uniref:Eco57I restriction-modification methylase domain-containing protein n=1 Tax=Pedobacter aquatilis TaxID=351343 RepID=UPI00292E2B4B|nr:N-6 DNA methylase [Pedobacter aquatilis]